jgi:hypothetical protein
MKRLGPSCKEELMTWTHSMHSFLKELMFSKGYALDSITSLVSSKASLPLIIILLPTINRFSNNNPNININKTIPINDLLILINTASNILKLFY